MLQLVTRDHLRLVAFSLDLKRAEGSFPDDLVGSQPALLKLTAPLLQQRRIEQQNFITNLEVASLDLLIVPVFHRLARIILDTDRLVTKGLQNTKSHLS